MFLFFGMNKQTMKKLGRIPEQICGHCQKPSRRVLIKVIDWFTVFFIPIFPFMTRYALVCPLCDDTREVTDEEMEEILKTVEPLETEKVDAATDSEEEPDFWPFGGDAEKHELFGGAPARRYEGKNATQIAYLAKLEAREKQMEAEQTAQPTEEAPETQAIPETQEVLEAQASPEALPQQVARERDAEQETSAMQETQAAQVVQAAQIAQDEPTVQEAQPGSEAYAYSLAVREKALEARESALIAREKALAVRENALALREKALDARQGS